MKKRYSKRLLSLMLSILLLLLSVSPTSVIAADEAEVQNDAQVEELQQQEEAQQPVQDDSSEEISGETSERLSEEGVPRETNEESSQEAEEETPSDNGVVKDQADTQSLDDTLTMSPIESIIGKDADGKELFYTTLLDSKDRIVDTTDPELEKDNHYKSKEEGGEAGTVDLNARLKVRFRMAAILEHDGDSGVQENVLYYMTLPNELVPVKQDSAGKVLVDPETPVTFFQSGDIQCVGGIYSVPDQDPEQYQLQMQFSDVEDQLNISGEFQYDVTVSDQLEEGTKCTVSYVPGGTLEFNITPKKEEPVETDESLTLTGQKNPDSTDKIDWTLTLTDKDMKMSAKRLRVRLGKGSVISAGPVSSKPSGNIGMSSVVITYQDGTTETLNYYQMNSSAYSLYRGEEGESPNPTMTDGSGDGKGILGTAYVDDSDYKSENTILASGYGNQYSIGKFLTDTLYIDMAALRSNGSSRGNNAGSSNPADIDLGICKYEFKFTSQVYDDYDISGNNYTATATMTDVQETTTLATTTAGTSISYGSLPSGRLDDTSSDEVNYFGIPSYIQTRYWINRQTYTGNHYSLKFAPQREYSGQDTFEADNNSDAIYYTSNRGFFSGYPTLVGDSGAAFEQLDIGNASEWTYCGPLSYDQIQNNDTNNEQSLGYKLRDDYDLLLKYQVQKVFENMDRNAYVEMYKSSEEVNGKTVYLFVDPDTRENAYYSVNNGWSRLASKTDASGNIGVNAESSCWKIHVFNAPAQSVSLSFKQSNGAAFADNVNVGGGATDTMVASYHVYGDTSDSGIGVDRDSYGFSRPAANVMTGRWLNDDTIFWEWTIDVENLQKNNSWYSSRAYIKVPGGQQLIAESPYLVQNPLADVDGAVVNMQQIQYYAGGTWNNFTGSKGTYRILGDLLTTNSNNPSRRLNDGYDEVYYADYGSLPTYDGRHVKIGFTTKVTGAYDSTSALKCEAELVPMMGETTQFGSSGAPYYPFKIYAEGSIGAPVVYKSHKDSGHTEADSDGVEHITDQWELYGMSVGMQQMILSSSLLDPTYIGFYSGVWSLHDDMKDAYTEDEEGSKIDVNPGKYTSLKEMSVIASGPGMSAEIFKLSEDDLKEVVNETDHKKSFTGTVNGKTVKLTLTYQGNMYDGFDAEVSGLKDVDVFKINYTTDFNQKDFFDGVKASGGDTSHFYTAVLKNGAHRGSQSSTGYPSESGTVKHRVVAALDINKAVAATPKKDEDQGGYSAQYQLDTQIGYTGSAYAEMEDFILGYTESKDDTGYQEKDADALKALVKSLKLSDLTIKTTDVNDKAQEIYSGKEENGSWTGNVTDAAWNVSFEYKPDTDHPGSLFKVRVSKADGSEISADYKFTVTYKMTVCMDESDTDFRDSGYYNGGELRITNGGKAVRTIKRLSETPDTQSVKTQAEEQEDLTLDADCGGGVTVSYLADKLVNKTVIPTSDSDVTKWMIYDWTGTKGKSDMTGMLTDALSYKVDEFSYIDKTTGERITLDQLDDKTKEELISRLAGLLYKYTTFKEVKLYYMNSQPKEDLSNLADEDLLYTFDESFGGTDAEKTYEETVTDKNGTSHNIELITGQSEKGQSAGFQVKANHLKINSYLVTTYETEIDWEKIYKALEDEYPQCSIKSSYQNVARNDEDGEKENTGNHVEVQDEEVEKSLVSSDSSKGTSSWKIKAYTGPNKNGELTLSDEITVNAADERIRKAAEQALAVNPDSVVVKYGDKIVYKNGKVAEGWTDENLTVRIDGRKLKVVIQNTVDKKVIFANSTYTVQYDTELDKAAYLANGGKAEDQVQLQNTVAMQHGSFSSSSNQTDELKPEVPISAKKSSLGNGSDGQDQTTALWQAVAKTGDAGRKNFVLKDSVNCSPADEKVQNALKLQDVKIKVKTGEAEEVVYTTDNLPEGVTFTEEGAGFTLIFAELPKDTTVTVDYAVHFDKDIYQAAGGESDVKVDLKNAFEVSSDDGYTASDDASGSIEYGEGFIKEGTVSSKKSSNGNPIIQWKMKVNLFDLYTAEEISQLTDVTVTDNLSSILSVVDGSVKLTTQDGKDIPQDVYQIEQTGNVLNVTLTDPKSYPIFNLEFETECGASVNGLVNDASLSVNGKKIEDASSDDVGKLEAANQYGWIKSMKVPEFTPIAYKYLDHELCTEKGLFQFSIVQVDENGNLIENGYQDTASNDENGQITFKKITYRSKPVEGSYYYQIRETSEVEPYTYTVDQRIFTVRVDVIASKGQYLVSYTVTDPENYDEVRFDNATITTHDFTVTKQWNDNDNKAGARPKSITVYLLNNGKRYNNMSVTLNEENNWTYTWKDLPMADADYSVEEAEVDNYTTEVETKDWSSVITNTYKPEKPKDDETPKDDKTPQDDKTPKDDKTPQDDKTPKNDKIPQNDKTPKNNDTKTSQSNDVNNSTNSPSTGDANAGNIELWILLMIAALCAGSEAYKVKKDR